MYSNNQFMQSNCYNILDKNNQIIINRKLLHDLIHNAYYYYMYADIPLLVKLIKAFLAIFRAIILKRSLSTSDIKLIEKFIKKHESHPPKPMPIYD